MFSKAVAAQVERHTDDKSATLSKTAFRKLLAVLGPNQNQSIYLRDGEVVLYQRSESSVWQVRYKLSDRRWHCVSTRHHRLDWAMRVAGEMYDRARFREEEGLPQKTRRFDAIARECCKALEQEIERGIRRETNKLSTS